MEGKIVVRLADGDRIAIPDAETMLVYDELWLGAMDVIGAVSTAGMIEYARRRARRGSRRRSRCRSGRAAFFGRRWHRSGRRNG
jgi:hypothetical protein